MILIYIYISNKLKLSVNITFKWDFPIPHSTDKLELATSESS